MVDDYNLHGIGRRVRADTTIFGGGYSGTPGDICREASVTASKTRAFMSWRATTTGCRYGIGRIHFLGVHEAQIRYMAVEESYRGRGVGKAVLARLEEIASTRGVVRIILNAREGALPFYARSGYRVLGMGHTLFGCIRHVRMEKRFDTGIGKKRQDDQP